MPAPPIQKYSIGKNRLLRGRMDGFAVTDDGVLRAVGQSDRHAAYLKRLDSGVDSCPWGRLCFHMRVRKDDVPILWAFASNETEFLSSGELVGFDEFLLGEHPEAHKRKLLEAAGASRFVGHDDVVLYEQKGRYLWLVIELIGQSGAEFEGLTVFAPGDSFFATFPEIYRMNGDFLHRYLSVFSSLYMDLQGVVNSLHEMIDIDSAPAGLLPVFAGWLGINLDGNFLEEKYLRRLLKEAFRMIQVKGTRQAVESIVRIFVEEPFYIVEQRQAQEYATKENRETLQLLYGGSPFDFTLLLNRPPDEQLHSRLMFLIGQFTPLRSRVNIVFLGDNGSMDAFCYLDINASIIQTSEGATDSRASLDGRIFLA